MEQLSLNSTYNTPKVDFKHSTGELLLEGRAIPEYATTFFTPLIDWIKEYAQSPAKSTQLVVKLDYVNSSSSKFLVELFENLQPIAANGNEVTILWYYEADDEEMKDTGEEYNEIIKVPFKIIEVEEI